MKTLNDAFIDFLGMGYDYDTPVYETQQEEVISGLWFDVRVHVGYKELDEPTSVRKQRIYDRISSFKVESNPILNKLKDQTEWKGGTFEVPRLRKKDDSTK